MGQFIYAIISWLLGAIVFVIIAQAVMSWLIAFNVINTRHPVVRQIENFLWAVTRPVLRPIQRVIPPLGAVDISPLIAIVLIQAARSYLLPWIFGPIIAALHG
jgi:YggT family protein